MTITRTFTLSARCDRCKRQFAVRVTTDPWGNSEQLAPGLQQLNDKIAAHCTAPDSGCYLL